MKVYYAGIGSREIPQDIADIMEELGYVLGKKGYILRSGGSPGADTAFELGAIRASGKYEIYLPWEGFGKREGQGYIDAESLPNYEQAVKMARNFHPDFEGLDCTSQKLIIRDSYQVLGRDLNTPCRFLICWTPDACLSNSMRSEETGGTGQAIAIAADHGIPIYNIKIESHREKLVDWLNNCN
ncbi:MAG: hypothetical protein ACOCQN_02275 [Halanaerobiaceae bacterium]